MAKTRAEIKAGLDALRCPTCHRIHGIRDGEPPEGCIRALKGAVHEYEDTFGLLFAARDIDEAKEILKRRVSHLNPKDE